MTFNKEIRSHIQFWHLLANAEEIDEVFHDRGPDEFTVKLCPWLVLRSCRNYAKYLSDTVYFSAPYIDNASED